MSNGRPWGEDAFTNVNRKTLSQSAWNALTDLQTLVPATAAVLFTIGDLDRDTSDWARENTPVFGSEQNAQDVSDILRLALQVETIATLVATPSGPYGKRWRKAKLKGLGVAALVGGSTSATTQSIKRLADRTRPNEDDDLSFPSAHASNSSAMATLSNRQLDAVNLPPLAKKTIRASNFVIASLTAYARVEGGAHFPSDVLAGSALGHFFGAFIYDAFIGDVTGPQRFQLAVGPSEEGMKAQIFIPLY